VTRDASHRRPQLSAFDVRLAGQHELPFLLAFAIIAQSMNIGR
jgi:hypothetical protein